MDVLDAVDEVYPEESEHANECAADVQELDQEVWAIHLHQVVELFKYISIYIVYIV